MIKIPRHSIYLRKGLVLIPTVARTHHGYTLEIAPVVTLPLSEESSICDSIVAVLSKGNPEIQAPPGRDLAPKPVMLQAAGVKSWAALEKSSVTWTILMSEPQTEIEVTRRNSKGRWEVDVEKTEKMPIGATFTDVAHRMMELLRAKHEEEVPNQSRK